MSSRNRHAQELREQLPRKTQIAVQHSAAIFQQDSAQTHTEHVRQSAFLPVT